VFLHGMMHIGQGLICASKMQDLIRAGFHFIVFLADWHSMINNKFGGDLEKIRTVGRYYKHCFTALGVPENTTEYIWASELAEKPEYWEKVLRIARVTTAQRVLRALPIMGRDMQSKENDAAAIFYPCMQAADIFQMRLDLACAGIDQRKAHILAREAGERLGWGKPVSLHTPMLVGLAGVQNTPVDSFDEDPKLNQVIAAKMSKSKPENNILIHDEPEIIAKKIQQAFCPPKVVEGNPILEYYRILVFENREALTLKRDAKYGGDFQVPSYAQLVKEYAAGKIHPQDLKTNMSRILSQKLEPVREYFKKNPQPLEAVRRLEKS
jgi:tyrosyl-tRNA synthetase